MKNSVGIIGFGRFGKLLNSLFNNTFEITIYDPKTHPDNMEKALSANTLFIAVPIREFENVIKNIADKLAPNTTVIDMCSVKVYPVNIMQQYLPNTINIIATHPLFGPDSIKNGHPLKIMMYKVRDAQKHYESWKQYFSSKQIEILEITPDEHDQQAAKSQGITHFIGRVLEELHAKPTGMDTAGYQALLKVMEQTCNDSWELFTDLQKYNPYTKAAIDDLQAVILKLRQEIK